jgi:hypothetical protein
MDDPSAEVLDAFGLSEPAVLLPGGQGETWRSGAVVLKRAVSESAWRAEVLAGGAATWTEARRSAYAPVIELALSYAG